MNTIGKNIADRRRALGFTQEQLAEKIGVSAQAISKWENDLTEPDARTLLTLADIFGTSVDDLLRGTAIPSVADDSKKPEDRTIKIHVTGDDTNVTVRVPAALLLEGDFSVFNIGAIDNSHFETIRSFLKNNTVGDVVDVNEGGSHVTITIE